MIAKEWEYVAVMFVGSPDGILWHVVFPKLGCALPEVSHLTRLWPGVINRHFCLLSQESDCRSSAFSEILTERLFVVQWVEYSPSGDTVYFPFLFSQYSRVSSQGFFSGPLVPHRDSVSVVSVSGALWSELETIHECILSNLELSHATRQIAHSSELMRGWISAGILCP